MTRTTVAVTGINTLIHSLRFISVINVFNIIFFTFFIEFFNSIDVIIIEPDGKDEWIENKPIADITELEKFRKQLNEENKKEGTRVTVLAFLMKALVSALKEFPRFNSSLDHTGENLIMKQYVNIGVAMVLAFLLKTITGKGPLRVPALGRSVAETAQSADGRVRARLRYPMHRL